MMAHFGGKGDRRAAKFFMGLRKEINIDKKRVWSELKAVTGSYLDLERWEHEYLSNDPETGHTAAIKRRLETGTNPFANHPGGSAARKKYGYLLEQSSGPLSDDLEAWEAYNLDKDGGTINIAKELQKGAFLFESSYLGGVQARPKYGWIY